MTRDPFTEAARAEAERRWSRDLLDDRPLPGPARMNRRIGFDLGAQWARTHLAAQETDGERAVRSLHRRIPLYEHEAHCPDIKDEGHCEAHHHENVDEAGDYYCDMIPAGAVCWTCCYDDGERADWPCATIQALDSARAARRDEEKRDG